MCALSVAIPALYALLVGVSVLGGASQRLAATTHAGGHGGLIT